MSLTQAMGLFTQRSYTDVDLSVAETSMQSVAVRSAVDLIASLSSELPVTVFSGRGSDRRERAMPSYLEDPGGDGTGLEDWCYRVVVSWLLRGNLYGEILETAPAPAAPFPTQVELFYPDSVSAWMVDGTVHWAVSGQEINSARFLHRRVNPIPGRVLGLSPIAFHADSIGLSLTSTRFGLQWFKDGAHPSGMLVNEETALDEKQSRTAKDRFMAALYGSREPVVLGKGWKYETIQVTAEESQFLKTQGFTAAECARIFGPGIAEVLGYDSGGSMTYANVVDRDLHLLKYALNKWLRRLERLLSSMLPRGQYVRLDRDALLQTSTLQRYQAHKLATGGKPWKTANEVRDDEDMPPVAWGNDPTVTSPVPAGDKDTEPEGPTS